MTELITINNDNTDRPTVMGRELHEALEIKTRYDKWFDRMCEYGFTENSDYIAIAQKRPTAQGNMTEYTDHQLTIDMAKEICMIQRTEIGRKCRQYFIEIEKQWNTPEAVMDRALKYADQKIKQLEADRQNAPITARQQSELWKEIDIKAIDLCNSGRLYKEVGLKLRHEMIMTIYERLGVSNSEEIRKWQYEAAIKMCRSFTPDKVLRAIMEVAKEKIRK